MSRNGLLPSTCDGSSPHAEATSVPSSVYTRRPVWSLSGSKNRSICSAARLVATSHWPPIGSVNAPS